MDRPQVPLVAPSVEAMRPGSQLLGSEQLKSVREVTSVRSIAESYLSCQACDACSKAFAASVSGPGPSRLGSWEAVLATVWAILRCQDAKMPGTVNEDSSDQRGCCFCTLGNCDLELQSLEGVR